MMVIEIILNDPRRGATLSFDAVTLEKYKVKNGIQAPDIVTPTLFYGRYLKYSFF